MTVFALGNTVLLRCMWTRHTVGEARALKIAMKLVVFTTPVGLDGLDFIIQEAFDMSLKVIEDLLNIRLMFKQINPSELAIVIDKADVIFFSTKRISGMAPYITENKL